MSLSRFLTSLAARLLPDHRAAWGEAMQREAAAIDDPIEAFQFAAGCLWAALAMSITVMKAFVFTSRLLVGAVTALYGLSFLYFMTNGLLHSKPFALLPALLTWQLAMGLSHIAAAAFLIVWKPKAFRWACAAAAAAGLTLTLFGIASMIMEQRSSGVLVFAVAWPLVPVAMLMTAAWLFAWLERGPKTLTPA